MAHTRPEEADMYRSRTTPREMLAIGLFVLGLVFVPAVAISVAIGVERGEPASFGSSFGRSLEPAACPQVTMYLDTEAVLDDSSVLIVTVEVPVNMEVRTYNYIGYTNKTPEKWFKPTEKINPNLGCREALFRVEAVLEGDSAVNIDLYALGVTVYQETRLAVSSDVSFTAEVHPHAPNPQPSQSPNPTKPRTEPRGDLGYIDSLPLAATRPITLPNQITDLNQVHPGLCYNWLHQTDEPFGPIKVVSEPYLMEVGGYGNSDLYIDVIWPSGEVVRDSLADRSIVPYYTGLWNSTNRAVTTECPPPTPTMPPPIKEEPIIN